MRLFETNRRDAVILPLLLCAVLAASSLQAAEPSYSLRMQPLVTPAPKAIGMDFIGFDPATGFIWAPAGNTGVVAVIDTESSTLKQIPGFATAELGTGERKRTVGPSAVTIGDGVVYIGNRGDSSVCAFDARTFEKKACHRFDSMPDGICSVTPTKELWVTTPRDKSIRILDGTTLEQKARLAFDGNPEGYAFDPARHRFYTNLEDKDLTLAIDLSTHKTVATWKPACGEEGPHGLRVDTSTGFLFVACSTRVEVIDAAHDGAVVSRLDTGDGVDDIDYAQATHLLYAGAGKAGQLVVARVDAKGTLTLVSKVPTHAGARNAAVTGKGVVYLAHSGFGGLTDLVVATPEAAKSTTARP